MAASCAASTRASPYPFAPSEPPTESVTLPMSPTLHLGVPDPRNGACSGCYKVAPRPGVRATGRARGTLLRCEANGDPGAHREHRLADACGGGEGPRPDGHRGGRPG